MSVHPLPDEEPVAKHKLYHTQKANRMRIQALLVDSSASGAVVFKNPGGEEDDEEVSGR